MERNSAGVQVLFHRNYFPLACLMGGFEWERAIRSESGGNGTCHIDSLFEYQGDLGNSVSHQDSDSTESQQ